MLVHVVVEDSAAAAAAAAGSLLAPTKALSPAEFVGSVATVEAPDCSVVVVVVVTP